MQQIASVCVCALCVCMVALSLLLHGNWDLYVCPDDGSCVVCIPLNAVSIIRINLLDRCGVQTVFRR
jgi:hypothetical protein